MKSRFSLLLALLITLLFSFNSFAFTASDSDAVKGSDDYDFDIEDTDTYFISAYSDDITATDPDIEIPPTQPASEFRGTVENIQDMWVSLNYYDRFDKLHSISKHPNSDGYFSFSKPSDYVSFAYFSFYLIRNGSASVLPSPGNYRLDGHFGSNAGGIPWSGTSHFTFGYKGTNAATIASYGHPSWTFSSGDFNFTLNLKVASNSQTVQLVMITKDSEFYLPFGGYISFAFTPISASSDSVSSSPEPPRSSDDIQSDISDSVVDISNTVNNISSSIADTAQSVKSGFIDVNASLRELIQTISLQLEAFWQQLYIGIHVPNLQNRDENTKKVTDAIDTLDSDVLDGFDKLEDSNNDNTSSIINNNNQNTNEINNNITNNFDDLKNGYDDSTGQEQNQILSDSLQEYQDLEDSLLNDAMGNLDTFQFDDPFLTFNAVMSDISYILSGTYDALGSFNIPIGFSFTLTVAMLCIGWYRFKAGA